MNKERILILDKERISWKLQRMAYEIWEHNSKEQQITLVGVHGSGLTVANLLAEKLRQVSKMTVQVATLKINKRNPLTEDVKIEGNVSGSSVVLVDDVANSGKTLIYALKPILDAGPTKITVAVLVDRKHKSFPVAPDIVGHSVATTLQEHIEVEAMDGQIAGVYLQ
jgi:pyrimidine operon attenuation protein / uracil phosphoribosyltransferase